MKKNNKLGPKIKSSGDVLPFTGDVKAKYEEYIRLKEVIEKNNYELEKMMETEEEALPLKDVTSAQGTPSIQFETQWPDKTSPQMSFLWPEPNDQSPGPANVKAVFKSSPRPSRGSNAIMEPVADVEMEDEMDLLPELGDDDAKLPADMEMFDTIRGSFKIVRIPERTLIYAIVIDKSGTDNTVAAIRCYGGVAFGGYARDCSNDTYLVECVQNVRLGTVPFSIKITMPKCDSWSVDVPIPEKILEKTFTPNQRKMLASLHQKFPKDRYDIHYLQMLAT